MNRNARIIQIWPPTPRRAINERITTTRSVVDTRSVTERNVNEYHAIPRRRDIIEERPDRYFGHPNDEIDYQNTRDNRYGQRYLDCAICRRIQTHRRNLMIRRLNALTAYIWGRDVHGMEEDPVGPGGIYDRTPRGPDHPIRYRYNGAPFHEGPSPRGRTHERRAVNVPRMRREREPIRFNDGNDGSDMESMTEGSDSDESDDTRALPRGQGLGY